MFQSRKAAVVAATLFTVGLTVVGSAFVDEHSDALVHEFPALKASVSAIAGTRRSVIATGEHAGTLLKGFVTNAKAMPQQLAATQQRVLQHPVLKGSIQAVDVASHAMAATGQRVFAETSAYLFPDETERVRRETAQTQIEGLAQTLMAKQHQANAINAEIHHIQRQMNTLEKTANPLKKAIPDGFGFLGFGNPPPGPTIPGVDLGKPPIPPLPGAQNSSPKAASKAVEQCSCP